jgi:hypothetical protein
MMALAGFFDLKTPMDLLRKLEREYDRWIADPLNGDLAWNFFVTAEHLPDWLARTAPRPLRGLSIHEFKQSGQLTRICSHLANGGKHFRPRKEHTAVASTHVQDGWIEEGWVDDDWIEVASLMVDLTPDEADTLQFPSESIRATLLATWLLAFWQTFLAFQTGP